MPPLEKTSHSRKDDTVGTLKQRYCGLTYTTLFERENENLSKLAIPFGVNWRLTNFTRTVQATLFIGGIMPAIGPLEDTYWVFHPGFSLPIG